MEKIEYYDNKQEHGIIIDWSKIFKAYRKLGVPDNYYNPTTAPVDRAKWLCLLSERASGKTTNWLLIGMLLYTHYGIVTQYIRQSEDMIKPSIANEIFAVIRGYDNGYYIKKITNGEYNSIYIHWKKAYFCHIGDDGKMDKLDNDHFMSFLSIDHNFDYKSTYNAPTGDLILFDEFISPNYRINEFVDLCDMCSTIIRKRVSPIIVMLANTIDCNHTYFKELEISKEVKKLKVGNSQLITTEKGTNVYVELIGLKPTEIKSRVNRLFYGFNNPRLAAITGGEQTWSFDPAPHIVNADTDVYIDRRLRIDTGDVILQVELLYTEDRGYICNVHECTMSYDDSVFLTNGEIRRRNQMWGLGEGKYCKYIWGLYGNNKWYFDTNETASLVTNYVKTYRQLRK